MFIAVDLPDPFTPRSSSDRRRNAAFRLRVDDTGTTERAVGDSDCSAESCPDKTQINSGDYARRLRYEQFCGVDFPGLLLSS
jgi:hypothetical protein